MVQNILEIKVDFIGGVVDILNHYLNLRAREYLCYGAPLSECKHASIDGNGIRINVYEKEKGKYLIAGFPEEADFGELVRRAQGIWAEIKTGRIKFNL